VPLPWATCGHQELLSYVDHYMNILEKARFVVGGLVALTYLGHHTAVVPRYELERREPSFRSLLFRSLPDVPEAKVVRCTVKYERRSRNSSAVPTTPNADHLGTLPRR